MTHTYTHTSTTKRFPKEETHKKQVSVLFLQYVLIGPIGREQSVLSCVGWTVNEALWNMTQHLLCGWTQRCLGACSLWTVSLWLTDDLSVFLWIMTPKFEIYSCRREEERGGAVQSPCVYPTHFFLHLLHNVVLLPLYLYFDRFHLLSFIIFTSIKSMSTHIFHIFGFYLFPSSYPSCHKQCILNKFPLRTLILETCTIARAQKSHQ